MTCCNRCAHCKRWAGTWYDPPESYCDINREEFEMDDSEYEAELEEKYGEDWEDSVVCECESFLDEDDVAWLRADSRSFD